MDEKLDDKDKIKQLEEELTKIKEEYTKLKQENKALTKKESKTKNKQFWDNVHQKCATDVDYIKSLIRDKTIDMEDTDDQGRTILMMAAATGSYDLVQYCANLGANIHLKCKENKTAINYAQGGSYYHVEQLLLFLGMNASVGQRVQQTAHTINKQNGIIQNIANQLETYDETTKQFFKDTMLDIMINIINKKLAFSDVLLDLCWSFENDPLNSDLWKQIIKMCESVISSGNKVDWFWFRNFILPSTIWFKDIGNDKDEKEEIKEETQNQKNDNKSYLYYELLSLVDTQANKQLSELEENLNKIANENKTNWDRLTSWDVETDEYEISVARQDCIPNGITSQYTDAQLFEYSSSTFNTHRFHDYNEYLPRLILLAQIVDDSMQNSVQKIFNIHKDTNIGYIDSAPICYSKGPVKLMSRARSKAENDYSNETFPSSACVLDFNRCSLVFDNISSLLSALELFINKVSYYQSGSIIGIVRVKNGFMEYIKQSQYSDIKLNVLIKGKTNNIIGEVQFLISTMKQFKTKAHNLYSVQRQKQFIDNSVSLILPMLLDSDKQSAVSGNMGNVKALCELMVINNKTHEDLLKFDKRGESILNNICWLGRVQAFNFLKSIVKRDLFVDKLLADSDSGTPIDAMIKHNRIVLLKTAFGLPEVQQRLHKNKKSSDTFIRTAMVRANKNTIDLLLNEFSIDNIQELVFEDDKYQMNMIEDCLLYDKANNLNDIMSIDGIKKHLVNNEHLLWRLIYWLFRTGTENSIDYMIKELSISNKQIIKCIQYKYPKSIKPTADKSKYHKLTILSKTIKYNDLNILKKLMSIIGKDVFCNNVFVSDAYNMNAMESAITENKLEIVKYLLSHEDVKNICLNNENLMWRTVFWLFGTENVSEEMIDFVLNELNISNETLIKLMGYKYDAKNDKNQYMSTSATEYQYCSILCQLVYRCNSLDRLKKLVSYIGEETLARYMFIPQRKNGYDSFKYCIYRTNVQMIEYILSIDEIKKKCFNDENIMGGIVHLMIKVFDEKMCKYLMNELKLNEKKLKDLQPMSNRITNKTISKLLACAQV
eukprot:333564_1